MFRRPLQIVLSYFGSLKTVQRPQINCYLFYTKLIWIISSADNDDEAGEKDAWKLIVHS